MSGNQGKDGDVTKGSQGFYRREKAAEDKYIQQRETEKFLSKHTAETAKTAPDGTGESCKN